MASSRDSSNGPDWMDVATAVQAVEEFHAVRLELIWELIPGAKAASWRVTGRAARRMGSRGALPGSVSRSVPLHGGNPVTAVATIFRLVYDLDKDCGAMWAQAELFSKA